MLEQTLTHVADLLCLALAHGHPVTFQPSTDSYDLKVEIERVREEDTIDRGSRDVSVDLNSVVQSIRR